jgi:hypothetical protein
MGYTGKQGGYRPQTGSNGGGGNWASKSRPAPVAPVQNNQAAAATDDDSYLVSTFLASKKVGNQHYTRVDERTLENLKKIAVGDMIIFGLSKKEEAKFPAYMKVLPSTTK